jgi:hypothetical protein
MNIWGFKVQAFVYTHVEILDLMKSFEIHTNANDFAIRGVLMQEGHLDHIWNQVFKGIVVVMDKSWKWIVCHYKLFYSLATLFGGT